MKEYSDEELIEMSKEGALDNSVWTHEELAAAKRLGATDD